MADVDSLFLPPGFRFHPTDEEIIVHYLQQKVADERFSAVAMGEVDLNSCEPWELPEKAKMGEKVWYFFCQKDRKYPTGTRTNRATRDGYWKATGKDKEIYKLQGGKAREKRPVLVGMKKTLVFYLGRAPKGEKTSWVMHEFRLEPYSTFPLASKDQEWVVCRIFHKNEGLIKKSPAVADHPSSTAMSMMMSMTPTTACNHQESTSSSSSSFFSSQMPPPNHPFFSSRSGSSAGSGYLRLQEELLANAATAISAAAEAFTGKCKVELQAVTSNSIPSHSHDTGISSDRNADISSYNGEDRHSNSSGPLLNLDNIWEY